MICAWFIAATLGIMPVNPTATPSPQSSPSTSTAASEPILPPLTPWNGKSRQLVVSKNDPWVTPSEANDLRTTPSYDETVAWLRKLVAAAPQLQMVSIGKSPEGRDIWLIIAAKERATTPEELHANGKPTVLAQAGIHAGEIDGKDAGLMLLRDMTVRGTKRELLDAANFLFVPIFNVDGHERTSRFGRVNQRGPEVMGWRTTSQNLNLNRDYAKADAPEMRAMLRLLEEWQPDLYFDLHVTDGADYQYDVTWGSNGAGGHSPAITGWLEKTLAPALTSDLTAMGHIPGSTNVANRVDEFDLAKGIRGWNADPRFSTGYGDVRHLPTVLVENHSLKPYDQRVLGMRVLLESALRTVAKNGSELRAAIAADRAARPPLIPLAWEVDPAAAIEKIDFKGIESRVTPSAISGGLRIEYTGKPITVSIPYLHASHVSSSVTRPKAYWIPSAWSDVIGRLRLHGIQMETLDAARDVKLTMYRLEEPKFGKEAFEGHVQVTARTIAEPRTAHMVAGSVRIPTDQPLGALASILLEPASPDSFFQWGFFDQVLQQTEYIEPYIIEPMAERMLRDDAKLAEEFRDKLAKDDAFRASAGDRLRWFYAKTPFVDELWRLYPVGREE
ncbi:MAG: M14 family metallopeptidase [Verrucomicrobiota bacterium]|nr:M14 family metallopeptidase [Verrucomicrobiota bacterium]